MDGVIEKVFDGFKRFTPALIAILVFTGLIIFLPESILEKMALQSIPDIWKVICGLAFLLSSALIISIICFQVTNKYLRKIKHQRFLHNRVKALKKLSNEQRKILKSLLESKDKSICLDSNSGNTIFLSQNGFIHQPQQICSIDETDSLILRYIPQLWLMELYQNNPKFKRILEND